jgi:hypothetical protein
LPLKKKALTIEAVAADGKISDAVARPCAGLWIRRLWISSGGSSPQGSVQCSSDTSLTIVDIKLDSLLNASLFSGT